MISIGFKCWGDRFTYVVLEGTQDAPKILGYAHIKAPAKSQRPEQLSWFRKEVHEVLLKYNVDVGFFKKVEPISRNKDMNRGEFEGVLQEAAYSFEKKMEIQGVDKKKIVRISGSNNSKYLGRLFQGNILEELNTSTYQDACLVALIGLPK